MKKLDIKGIIFDYGGTLDTRGDHWSEVLWQGYEHFGIGVADDEEVEPGVSISKQAFRDAYVYGERALAVNPIVTPDFHFEDILREKLILELNFLAGKELLETGKDDAEKQAKLGNDSDASSESLLLSLSDSEIHQIAVDMAHYINAKTLDLLQENKQVLEHLKQAGACFQFLWQYQPGVEGCGDRWLFQGGDRIRRGGRPQTESCHLRPGRVCLGFASLSGIGGGRYLRQGYHPCPQAGLPHPLDQGIAVGGEAGGRIHPRWNHPKTIRNGGISENLIKN